MDGHNGLGQAIGKYCMELAIDKARKFGIGMVSARGSNHYGICGYYSLMAIEQGMIGFSCTNTSPLMVPTRSRQRALGTNPLSLGIGVDQSNEFVLDMATTAVALGKIEIAVRKDQPIPEGWALNSEGLMTTDAVEASKAALLMPVGGSELSSGYKGYGLALMVEILCGILSGSHYGPNIRKWQAGTEVADLGQCFMVINPDVFAPEWKNRLGHLLDQMRDLPKIGDESVLVPGDPEKAAMAKADSDGGMTYTCHQMDEVTIIAERLKIDPMMPLRLKS